MEEVQLTIATLTKNETMIIAEYVNEYRQSPEKVWDSITNNEHFKKWMAHLEIVDLRKNGKMLFNYNDGSGKFEEMKITDYENQSVIEFEWGEDTVRFEVLPTDVGSKLIMKEFINHLTDHTPKDLAGWQVCLMHLSNVITDELIEIPDNEWEKWYEEYKVLVEQYR